VASLVVDQAANLPQKLFFTHACNKFFLRVVLASSWPQIHQRRFPVSTYNVQDDPCRVAGPGELQSDHSAPAKDSMDAYKESMEADDAERIYRGNLLQYCASAMTPSTQLHNLFTDFNSVFGGVK
jgi:hypothetical protein